MNRPSIETAADNICQLENLDREASTVQAAVEYLTRKHRLSHPDGDFGNAGRFYLSAEEKSPCCVGIRNPSRAFPNSEMLHGRSTAYVAALFDTDTLDVRRLARRIEAEASRGQKK